MPDGGLNPGTPGDGDIGTGQPGGELLLERAGEVFLSIREMGLAQREGEIDRLCSGSAELKRLVEMLMRGDQMPLAVESLADDIRASADRSMGPEAPGPGAPRVDRIGNYRLLERLGEGGFGVVFMAEQERPVRRRVALKIIKLGMDTRQVVARFEAERQALAMMDHPHIARVFDAGATETGRPYFVMELVRGKPITDFCNEHLLGVRERLALVSQVCDALQHAHLRGIIHRDIKPSNVIVGTIEGDKPLLKIIDFGVAKATSARLTDRTLFTEFRQMIGTPEYMSPEQASDSAEDIDTRADIYAVGVLLYELLTGVTPLDSKRLRSAALAEMQRLIQNEDPPKPSTRIASKPETLAHIAGQRSAAPAKLVKSIRGELDWIVMKAIEKDRSRRYASAGSMGADIQRYLVGDAVRAAPPSRSYLLRKFAGRNKGPVIAGSLLTMALLAGLVGTSLGYRTAERQRRLAEAESSRADAKAAQAITAEALSRRQAYSANMLSASAAIGNVNFAVARGFLDAAPESLRGWEWRVLNASLDSSIRAFPAGNPVPSAAILDSSYTLIAHPDGESFFTTDLFSNGGTKQWNARTGAMIRGFPRPQTAAGDAIVRTYVALSADGSRLFQLTSPGVNREHVLEVRDTLTGDLVLRNVLPLVAGAYVDVNPELSLLQSHRVHGGHSPLVMTDLQGQEVSRIPNALCTEVRGMFSPTGALCITADTTTKTLTVREAPSLRAVATLAGHDSQVLATSFSNDERWLGSAADDDTARVWDLSVQPPSCVVLRHSSRVWNIRFSPDASRVFTVARDRAIRVWDRASGELRATYASPRLLGAPLMVMRDGSTVAGQETDGTVRFWDVTAENTRVLRGHSLAVTNARWVPNNPAGIIISAGWDGLDGTPGVIRIWDSASGEPVAVCQRRAGDSVMYRTLALSGDGKIAAVGVRNRNPALNNVELLNLTTGHRVVSHGPPADRNTWWLGFGADDSTLLHATIAAYGNEVAMRLAAVDLRSGSVVEGPALDPNLLWLFEISPDRKIIVAVPTEFPFSGSRSSRPGAMLILDAATLRVVRTIGNNSAVAYSLAISADGRRLATGGYDGVISIYDLESGGKIATLSGHDNEVYCLAFSPDGTRLATGGIDRVLRIWNTQTFDQVAALPGHHGHIGDLEWSTDGQSLVSASGDSTIRIWETTPIRVRVQARAARQDSLARVQPLVARLFGELIDPEKVVEHLSADPTLSELDKRTALQLVLRSGLQTTTPP